VTVTTLDRDKFRANVFFAFAKSVTEKNNIRVDCAEVTKKTVQVMRYKWWGFFVAGDCPAELLVINFQAKPDSLL
jgi:hypothetical protein